MHDRIKPESFLPRGKRDNEIIFNLCPFQALSTPVILGIIADTTGCEFILRLVIIPTNYSFGWGRKEGGVISDAPSGALYKKFLLKLHK